MHTKLMLFILVVPLKLRLVSDEITSRDRRMTARRDNRVPAQAPSLTVLVKSRHYAHFFKQEVSLDGRTRRV